jgi:hypothetical protein
MRWLRNPRPRVRLEFEPKRRSGAAAWLLLAVACGIAADVGWRYVDVQARSRQVMRRLAVAPAAAPLAQQLPVYQPKDVEREAAFARNVITRIATPWNELFKALAATQVDQVRLLGVEPDTEGHTVRISAEAPDVASMLTFVSRLESHPYFRRVGLLEHEEKRDGQAPALRSRGAGAQPVRVAATASPHEIGFVVVASWGPK